MIDELESLRATHATVAAPTAEVRGAARARWDHQAAELAPAAPLRAKNGARTFALRAAIAGVTSLAVVAGAWFVTRARIESVKPSHTVSVGPLAAGPATDPQVFLLVGSDSRAFVSDPTERNQFGDPDTIGGARADTMVLVRIDPTTHRVLLVSIPRDLSVAIPGHGTDRINAAFAFGGEPLLVQTITSALGVPINHVIEVEFPQFASLVDQLGGMRIQFPVPTRDKKTGLAQSPGCVTLAGDQALAFVRSRFYETLGPDGRWTSDPTSDLGRTVRQQLALRQLAVAAQSRLDVDPRPLLRALFASVTVDTGFTADDALRYFAAMRDDHQITTATLPVEQVMRDDQEMLQLEPGAQPILAALAGHGTPAAPATAPASHEARSAPTAC